MKKISCIAMGIFLVSALLGAAWIRVTSPAAGITWCWGTTCTITWTKSDDAPATVSIRLRRAGSPESDPAVLTIARGTANDLGEPWPIPDTLEPGDYFIRIWCSAALYADSPTFRIASCPLDVRVTLLRPLEPLRIRTLTMPVTFNTKMKMKERHSWNCLATMGTGAIDVPPSEMLVGFFNRREHRGALCADECVSQVYRGSPLWDAARLRTLVGKSIVKAMLSFRHKNTECNSGAWTICLAKVIFYAGRMGEENPPPSETRILAVSISGTYQFDVTDMMKNWLREKDPSYHGERHNYHMEFVGVDERMEYNSQKCLSWFDSGSLEIKYRD